MTNKLIVLCLIVGLMNTFLIDVGIWLVLRELQEMKDREKK